MELKKSVIKPIVQYLGCPNKENPGIFDTIMEEVIELSHFHLPKPGEVVQMKILKVGCQIKENRTKESQTVSTTC